MDWRRSPRNRNSLVCFRPRHRPSGHYLSSTHEAKPFKNRALLPISSGPQQGIRTMGLSNLLRNRAWCDSAIGYDPLPPTAPLAARSPCSAWRFRSRGHSPRRRPARKSETPNHFRHRRPSAHASIAGQRRLRRSRLSDAGRTGARHGRSPQPHAQDYRRRITALPFRSARR
jgi:hypothetical protein